MNPTIITRDPEAAGRDSYDLLIVGGGIYGAMLALESSLNGLRPLLLEKEDFGGATSFNSLRIIHGGLRYLQGLDLPRFFESVAERRWLLKTFPEQVRPLPCLMPLYGQGLKRPAILRLALAINDRLSRSGNEGLAEDSRLPGSRVIGPAEVKAIFPAVDPRDLRGGAVWYDAAMEDSQRVLMGVLGWACAAGAQVLNYVEARELLRTASGVAGVRAWDRESGQGYEYRSGVVINAAGPWCREVAARFDRDPAGLFHPSLAWNVLFDRAALSPMALGVAPKTGEAPMYFLRPWKGKLLAGMGHHPGLGSSQRPSTLPGADPGSYRSPQSSRSGPGPFPGRGAANLRGLAARFPGRIAGADHPGGVHRSPKNRGAPGVIQCLRGQIYHRPPDSGKNPGSNFFPAEKTSY